MLDENISSTLTYFNNTFNINSKPLTADLILLLCLRFFKRFLRIFEFNLLMDSLLKHFLLLFGVRGVQLQGSPQSSTSVRGKDYAHLDSVVTCVAQHFAHSGKNAYSLKKLPIYPLLSVVVSVPTCGAEGLGSILGLVKSNISDIVLFTICYCRLFLYHFRLLLTSVDSDSIIGTLPGRSAPPYPRNK